MQLSKLATTDAIPAGGTGADGRKAAGDAAFSVAERIVSQAATLTVFILAARLLGPAEFGVFALASAIAILLLCVAEAGWAPFIMSRSDSETVPLQVLFVALIAGVACGAAGAIGAVFAGSAGLAPDAVRLMILFSVWVALANATSAQKGILVWMGRLKAACLCAITAEIVALVVSVATLMAGSGVFALVYGRIAGQSTALILSFAVTRRLPRPGLTRLVQRELLVFSGQIFASRMLVQIRLQLVTIIIGGFLGVGPVGLFRAAERLVGALSELVVVPGQLLAWTQLRHARDAGDPKTRTERTTAQMARILRVLVMLGAPLFLWLILMNNQIAVGLLGPEWLDAGPLIAILALGRLMLFPGILTEPLLTILGEARVLPRFMATIFAVSVALTFAAALFGLHALAWSQVVVAFVVLVATIRLFADHAGVRWGVVLEAQRGTLLPLFAGVSAIVALDFAASGRGLPDLVEAVGFGLIGGAVYGATFLVSDATLRSTVFAAFRPARADTRATR